MIRVGIGYDMHRLQKRRKLILGGINIPARCGLLGHSDADVLLHAIIDALLGAAAQKDIGEHFPDSDDAYKDISSVKLLKKIHGLLRKMNYSIVNIDSTIVIQKPSLIAWKEKMCRNIARTLNVSVKQVSVKATTAEGLGQIGRGKAISAYAVVLLRK